MLQSYRAQLDGEKIIWLDQAPRYAPGSRVIVVVEDQSDILPPPAKTTHYEFTDLVGRMQWTGNAVTAQRDQRDAW